MTRKAAIIVDRLGPDNAARLSRIAGGTRLHVPSRVEAPSTGGRDGFKRLERLLGYDLAVLVVLHFGDSRLYVPRADRSDPVDVKTVARLTRRGLSASKIAKKLKCSDRTVHAKRAQALTLGLVCYPEGGKVA